MDREFHERKDTQLHAHLKPLQQWQKPRVRQHLAADSAELIQKISQPACWWRWPTWRSTGRRRARRATVNPRSLARFLTSDCATSRDSSVTGSCGWTLPSPTMMSCLEQGYQIMGRLEEHDPHASVLEAEPVGSDGVGGTRTLQFATRSLKLSLAWSRLRGGYGRTSMKRRRHRTIS